MMTIGEEAVGLLEDLPIPWEAAALALQRKLLLTMLDAVYVDTVDEKTIVAIRHKAVFCPLLENAMTLVGNGVALKKIRRNRLILSLARLNRVLGGDEEESEPA